MECSPCKGDSNKSQWNVFFVRVTLKSVECSLCKGDSNKSQWHAFLSSKRHADKSQWRVFVCFVFFER